jgi:threonine synthase
MASALSYINMMVRDGKISDVLAICASTGDTSASAALYASYLTPHIKSAVLLPHKKVTPQQLSQPLGSGAAVFEIPGVFDDCMKVVEALSENYNVALLNSKNAWRILGQESYCYELAQDFEYEVSQLAVVVPIGNAGNITALMSGFIKFVEAGVINALPKIVGVQSEHANPVYRYYLEPDRKKRKFEPVSVKPSVAQAAMIGNPVSMPRVIHLVERYNQNGFSLWRSPNRTSWIGKSLPTVTGTSPVRTGESRWPDWLRLFAAALSTEMIPPSLNRPPMRSNLPDFRKCTLNSNSPRSLTSNRIQL